MAPQGAADGNQRRDLLTPVPDRPKRQADLGPRQGTMHLGQIGPARTVSGRGHRHYGDPAHGLSAGCCVSLLSPGKQIGCQVYPISTSPLIPQKPFDGMAWVGV